MAVTGTRGPREANGNSFFNRTVTIGSFAANGSRTGGATAIPLTDSAAGPFAVELDLGVGSVDLTAGAVNQVALWADFARQGAAAVRDTDAEAYTLYRQTITTVTATSDRTNVAPGEAAAVTVKVVDQRDRPMVGVQVRQVVGSTVTTDITFTPSGTGPREVGSSVTLTYEALDQLGQPISDLFIAFTRSGPGAGSDTSGSSNTLTGADGTATYTFVGSVAGRADVTANARQGSATGDAVSAASRTASVTFEEEQVDPVKPRIETVKRVKGDKLVLIVTVTASTQDPVQGDVVLKEGGKRLAAGALNSQGSRKLVVRGLDRGFDSLRLVFRGNDLVRKQSRTINITIR
ncbi:hypothetical protein GCM10027270_34300 [Nocardioides ginkgobilobae]